MTCTVAFPAQLREQEAGLRAMPVAEGDHFVQAHGRQMAIDALCRLA